MHRSIMTCARPLLAIATLLGLASQQVAQADTTVPITGIGTSVTGAFVINTHADSVTYSDPVDVVINGMAAVEIRGTVSGVGWGGSGIVTRRVVGFLPPRRSRAEE